MHDDAGIYEAMSRLLRDALVTEALPPDTMIMAPTPPPDERDPVRWMGERGVSIRHTTDHPVLPVRKIAGFMPVPTEILNPPEPTPEELESDHIITRNGLGEEVELVEVSLEQAQVADALHGCGWWRSTANPIVLMVPIEAARAAGWSE